MKNKKTLMFISALMIIVFHLWINIFNSNIENYIRYICFIGVDIFFFISAYNIGNRKEIDYKKFIKNRLGNIYIKYIIYAIIAFIFYKWNILKLGSVLVGIDFINRGGGSFLWFIPAIMIVYLLLPLYKKIDLKYERKTPVLFSIIFIIISIFISITGYKSLFIFTNRIPIILIGYYFGKDKLFDKLHNNKKIYYLISILLFIVGNIISYLIYINHISFNYFIDIFYIMAIPLTMGLIFIFDLIKSNMVIDIIGNSTLEIYAIQMIFGSKITLFIYNICENSIITNILSIIFILIISIILSYTYKKIAKLLFNY